MNAITGTVRQPSANPIKLTLVAVNAGKIESGTSSPLSAMRPTVYRKRNKSIVSSLSRFAAMQPETKEPITNEPLKRAKTNAIDLSEPPRSLILKGKIGSRKKTPIPANTQVRMMTTTFAFLKKQE